MKDTRSKFLSRVLAVLFLSMTAATFGMLQAPDNLERGDRAETTAFLTQLEAFEGNPTWGLRMEPVLAPRGAVPNSDNLGGGNGLITGESLLKRRFDADVEEYDVELIYADEGGELEVWENEIDIPQDALAEDTLMLLYIPRSAYIEYWVYPPSMMFLDTIKVELSYEFADMKWVDETNISVAQWVPDFQMWENIGGEVDTLDNKISFKTTSLTPPGASFSRYALADHN